MILGTSARCTTICGEVKAQSPEDDPGLCFNHHYTQKYGE